MLLCAFLSLSSTPSSVPCRLSLLLCVQVIVVMDVDTLIHAEPPPQCAAPLNVLLFFAVENVVVRHGYYAMFFRSWRA